MNTNKQIKKIINKIANKEVKKYKLLHKRRNVEKISFNNLLISALCIVMSLGISPILLMIGISYHTSALGAFVLLGFGIISFKPTDEIFKKINNKIKQNDCEIYQLRIKLNDLKRQENNNETIKQNNQVKTPKKHSKFISALNESFIEEDLKIVNALEGKNIRYSPWNRQENTEYNKPKTKTRKL